jgi:hypothetical protein
VSAFTGQIGLDQHYLCAPYQQRRAYSLLPRSGPPCVCVERAWMRPRFCLDRFVQRPDPQIDGRFWQRVQLVFSPLTPQMWLLLFIVTVAMSLLEVWLFR